MKRVLSAIQKILKRERGFTLVEMVTVVAIMGVMAAVAVPMVNSQLGKSREASYDQDQALIQTAVDSYKFAGDNVAFGGLNQWPIEGANSGSTALNLQTGVSRASETVNDWLAADSSTALATPLNPLRGTQGGEPRWIDGLPPVTPRPPA